GSPLLIHTNKGEAVVGVLYGRGALDPGTCGMVNPPLPEHHGSYTQTFRTTGPMPLRDWFERHLE
ncbi:MAG: hypothetical protein AAFQ66_09615, partial [Pseudomonadota bacterium]